MKKTILWLMGLSILMITGSVYAGTVYQWTDENGVRHFSNTGAPETVDNVDTSAEKRTSPAVEDQGEQDAVREQDEIISNAPNPETSTNPETSASPGTSTPTVRERAEELEQARLSKQTDDERQRLEAEIAQVEQRSLSRTFTEGMRNSRLDPLNEQLALLNSDPAGYFRMKQQGAFVEGGRTSSNRDRRGGRTGAMREQMQ